MRPLCSVIIPLYNAEKYIDECIQSVLAQTWTDTEIIIINDGSTDHSSQIAGKYESDVLKVYDQPNSGASAARNHGLELAKGKYIQFLDADDILSPDKIECQVAALEDSVGKLAVCSTIHFRNGQDHLQSEPSSYEDSFLYSTDHPAEFLVRLWGGFDNRGSMVQTNAWLTPRALIDKAGKWLENGSPDDDGEFFTRVILQSKGTVKTGGYNYYRKVGDGNNLASQMNYKSLNALFESALSKKRHLLASTDTEYSRFAIRRILTEIAVRSYPAHPGLANKIIKELPVTKRRYNPHIGGRMINLISAVLGWKTTLKLKSIFR